MLIASASWARGTGFDPRRVGKEISVSEHAFLRVICRDDMKTVCRPSDWGVNCVLWIEALTASFRLGR